MLDEITGLSIIIPVYNECDNVVVLYNEIISALHDLKCKFEVIFVDDGSNDNTSDKVLSLQKEHHNLKLVRHKKNAGQSAALVSGARAANYNVLVTLDGDGQNDPFDIPKLLSEMRGLNTVVLGNRQKRDDNFIRILSSRVGNSVRRMFLHDNCPDTGCSLKLFAKDAFLQVPHFNHLHRYLPALFKRQGMHIVNVKVNHRPRVHGISKYGIMNRLFVGIS